LKQIAEQKAALQRELERAERLAATDPTAAEAIWQGIVTLYSEKLWAQSFIETARSRLRRAEEAVKQ
jgi:hypothetical protein